ncbi:MAG: hypothetical protein CMP08_01270 [Xanthomonadales bacterium]|nr:hypothetical protein [Xanthomonadales bacterium]
MASGERQSIRHRQRREPALSRARPTAFVLLALSIVFGGAVPARADNVIRFVGRVVETTDPLDTDPRHRSRQRKTLAAPPGRAEVARWLSSIRARRPELGVHLEPVDQRHAVLRISYP